MRKLLVAAFLFFASDYVAVAFLFAALCASLHRAKVRELASDVGASVPVAILLLAIQWPWLAWCALTGRAR